MIEINLFSLALMDFIPSIAFAAGAYFLIQWIHLERGKPSSYWIVAGSGAIFLGGFLKAIWKLLYVANIANFGFLSDLQFVLLAPGFLLLFIHVLQFNRTERATNVGLLAILPWKIPLLIVMVLSSLGMNAVLIYICLQRHSKLAAAGFILAFLSVLGMGFMSGSQQTVILQWAAESVNSIGQIGFAIGCYLLYHASNTRSFAVNV